MPHNNFYHQSSLFQDVSTCLRVGLILGPNLSNHFAARLVLGPELSKYLGAGLVLGPTLFRGRKWLGALFEPSPTEGQKKMGTSSD